MEEKFRKAYIDLERRMKALAESDGAVYLPNPEPRAPVDYILICMEPSLGHWAKGNAQKRVESGFRNFLIDIEPMLLHFSVRRFLCENGQRYHITDFCKGAMLVENASVNRDKRYASWYPLLKEEIDLIAPRASVIAVGNVVAKYLRQNNFPREFKQVIHYSPLAVGARNARLKGHEERFRKFESSITSQNFMSTVRKVLDESGVPIEIYNEALTSVQRSRLSESRRKLVYCYKLDFDAMKALRHHNEEKVVKT